MAQYGIMSEAGVSEQEGALVLSGTILYIRSSSKGPLPKP